MKIKRLAFLWILLSASGCATNTGTPFHQALIEPKPDTGTVIFYREPALNFLGFSGPIGRWAIEANSKPITALGAATYTKVELAPGMYKFSGKTSAIDTVENIAVKPGAVQYVKTFSRGVGGGWFCYIVMKEIDEQTAKHDLHDMTLQINNEPQFSAGK